VVRVEELEDAILDGGELRLDLEALMQLSSYCVGGYPERDS
jgi:hypothetical protein